jgi:hypothetical protein
LNENKSNYFFAFALSLRRKSLEVEKERMDKKNLASSAISALNLSPASLT